MQNLDKNIISDEVLWRKEANVEGHALTERVNFVREWQDNHSKKLLRPLGCKDDDLQFLNGLLFPPSFVTTTIPHLQKVFMADFSI